LLEYGLDSQGSGVEWRKHLANKLMNRRVSQNAENFLVSSTTVSFPRGISPRGVRETVAAILSILINHMWHWTDKLHNLLILEDGDDLRI